MYFLHITKCTFSVMRVFGVIRVISLVLVFKGDAPEFVRRPCGKKKWDRIRVGFFGHGSDDKNEGPQFAFHSEPKNSWGVQHLAYITKWLQENCLLDEGTTDQFQSSVYDSDDPFRTLN
jgi:hypothetical protein